MFKVKDFENVYISGKCHGIDIQRYVSSFAALLLERNTAFEKRNIEKNISVYFGRTTDGFFSDDISEPSSF